jgi:radical SAM superfamily enzyme YgiQ (UPF0313 family)
MAHPEQSFQTGQDVLLVGYEDRDNLGLRYLLSSLRGAGYRGEIVRYRSDPQQILRMAQQERPLVIGFSLIFQYMAPDFARVIEALRSAKVTAHITMGGHYPSFDPEEVLQRIPGIDTVVRYEGEATLIELVSRLLEERDWRDIDGIAFRRDGEVVINPLRPAIKDLDTLPVPDRQSYDYESEALPTAAILGSRGCPWDCTFCSIRPFYEAQGGALRRFRKPEAVVQEMADLYSERGVSLFLFQDDDFLAGARFAQKWACEIADGLIERDLNGKIAFKMSCRSDEVDRDCLEHLQRGGLTHVYMGVEAGDEGDLLAMNKRLKPSVHIEAGKTLRSLNMSFDFGFMLLQPYSTYQSIRNNIQFLDDFVGDGWAVASFCRMLPYAGTPIKTKLEEEGRLLGNAFEPDYKFLDPKIDLFYDWMLATFHERNFTSGGLCHILRAMLFEAYANLSKKSVTEVQRSYLHHLTSVCNRTALYTLTAALDHIEATPMAELERDNSFLRGLSAHEQAEERQLLQEVAELYGSFASSRRVVEPQVPRWQTGAFDKTWTQVPNSGVVLGQESDIC